MLTDFPHHTPARATRCMPLDVCPLCGRSLKARGRAGFAADDCTLGACAYRPPVGSIEVGRIERNREILRGDLVEVEFSLLALDAAIAAGRQRHRNVGGYLEQKIPLVYRRTILRSYVE